MLIERFDIQINKTSRTTILFMVNIGSTRGSATYLLDVLVRIAEELEEHAAERDQLDSAVAARRVRSLVEQFPPLPHFTSFHPAFVTEPGDDHHEGDMRRAFFLSYDEEHCEYLPLDGTAAKAVSDGRALTSAAFVTPYPPGFPVLVPGQIISLDILNYLKAVDVKEIHGFEADRGLRVFRQDLLDGLPRAYTAAAIAPAPATAPLKKVAR
jgi:arginine decarboxylase